MRLAQYEICLQENTLLKNTYQIKKLISKSELSIVYMGENIETEEVLVIKEFFPNTLALRDLDDVTVLSRLPSTKKQYKKLLKLFLKEADILKMLNHESIVAHYDHFEENGSAYIVMEYCEGKSLEQYVQDCQGEDSSLAIYKMSLAVIRALNYIHKRGIIHRDIKPANIMVDLKGNPRILDFGSAVYLAKECSHMIFTTTGYSPLELYAKNSKQGVYSDIYSLAATLYYAFSGTAPVDVSKRIIEDKLKSVRKYNPKISPILSSVMMWSLAVQPRNRCFSLKFLSSAIVVEIFVDKMKTTLQ